MSSLKSVAAALSLALALAACGHHGGASTSLSDPAQICAAISLGTVYDEYGESGGTVRVTSTKSACQFRTDELDSVTVKPPAIKTLVVRRGADGRCRSDYVVQFETLDGAKLRVDVDGLPLAADVEC